MTNTSTDSLEEYELTGRIAPYLDAHLMLPLLDFMDKTREEGNLSYEQASINEARLTLLKGTNMVDYAVEKGATITPEEKAKVVTERDELKAKCASLIKLCERKVSGKLHGYEVPFYHSPFR